MSAAPPSRAQELRKPALVTPGAGNGWAFGGLGAALAAAYALLLLWPMRIWHRPVSPFVHLVGTFGVSFGGALTYVLTVLLLFALYGGALWLVLSGRARPSTAVVLAGSALFCALLLFTHPLTSTDIFNYIASARVYWVHGANPLTTPPLAFPDDPLYQLVSSWREIPSPYGPLWSLITALPVRLGGDDALRSVLAFKLTVIVFFLATAWLIRLTAERIRTGSGVIALLAFCWNPLALWHVAGDGHNDVVMLFFLALTFYCLARGWIAATLVALAASALVKYASLLIAPALLVWWLRSRSRPRPRDVTLGAAGGVALAAVCYAPFWAGRATFATTLDEGSYFTVSVPAVVRAALVRFVTPSSADAGATVIARLAFLAALALILARLRGDRLEALIAAAFLSYFAYLTLAATYFAPWYVLWPFSLAVLLPHRRDLLWPALAWTLSSMAVLVAAVWFREHFAPDRSADWYGTHLFAVAAVFPLPVALWSWLAWQRRGQRGAVAPDETPLRMEPTADARQWR